jgi:hypothetical protein
MTEPRNSKISKWNNGLSIELDEIAGLLLKVSDGLNSFPTLSQLSHRVNGIASPRIDIFLPHESINVQSSLRSRSIGSDFDLTSRLIASGPISDNCIWRSPFIPNPRFRSQHHFSSKSLPDLFPGLILLEIHTLFHLMAKQDLAVVYDGVRPGKILGPPRDRW